MRGLSFLEPKTIGLFQSTFLFPAIVPLTFLIYAMPSCTVGYGFSPWTIICATDLLVKIVQMVTLKTHAEMELGQTACFE